MTNSPAAHGRSRHARFTRTIQLPEASEVASFLDRAGKQPTPIVPSRADLHAERDAERRAAADSAPLEDLHCPGRDTPIPVRVCRAEKPTALVLNMHASGWVRGLASWTDGVADALRTRHAITSLAPSYRLAPEHPHPSACDDVYDTICWAVDSFAVDAGVRRMVVLGSSAGAHLAVLALLRLRDQRPDVLDRLSGLVLSYGIYDLSRTPAMRLAPAATPVVSPVPQARYLYWAFPDTDDEQRRDPDLSPLYADLTGLPPALFTACERDPLRDDSLFMSARWADAGNDTDLDIWDDCVHSFDRHYPSTGQRYADRVGAWITALDAAPTQALDHG